MRHYFNFAYWRSSPSQRIWRKWRGGPFYITVWTHAKTGA